jgi:hypothetical protein
MGGTYEDGGLVDGYGCGNGSGSCDFLCYGYGRGFADNGNGLEDYSGFAYGSGSGEGGPCGTGYGDGCNNNYSFNDDIDTTKDTTSDQNHRSKLKLDLQRSSEILLGLFLFAASVALHNKGAMVVSAVYIILELFLWGWDDK